jgi:uncharacterized small protein (DUF1192 family)
MDEEEVLKPKGWSTRNIEDMSVDQLGEYVVELEAEIERVQADIVAKKAHIRGAEDFFKK